MAQVLYVNADSVAGPPRAQALGCGWLPIVPASFPGAVAPCVILAGGVPFAVVVITDSPPTSNATVAAALAPLLAQEATAAATVATGQANSSTIQTNLVAQLATIEAFITAHPGGAVLTAGQTLVLAQMLAGITRVLLGLTSTVGGS